MTITATSILKRVTETLQDPTSTRWTAAELCRYFNDGQREIVIHRPDATATNLAHDLVAGARQSLPANGAKLIEVINNVGTKKAIRQCSRAILDAQLPGWMALTGVTEIQHVMYDVRDPKTFYVYPPAAASGAALNIVYCAYPADISEAYADGAQVSAVTGNLALQDLFANALRDYVLYRCFSKEGEHPANRARAGEFYAAFASAIGLEGQRTADAAPVKDSLSDANAKGQ